MPDTPKVALLMRMSVGYDRGIMRGIVNYSRLHNPWSFLVPESILAKELVRLKEWGCMGLVAQIENKRTLRFIQNLNVPVIIVPGVWPSRQYSLELPERKIARIVMDRGKISHLVVEHFHRRGFRHLAFCGFKDTDWSLDHQEKFCKQVRGTGREAMVYRPPRLQRDSVWPKEQPHLAQWLSSLPKPVGIMACCDDRGRQIIETCSISGIKVPEEISVVGVDNDDLVCNMANPPMSSVAANTQQAGFAAAELLKQMMKGQKVKKREIVVEPEGVVTRVSSDILAISDPMIAEAVRFIRKHAREGIQVQDVAGAVCVSRRQLQLSFQSQLGRSIHDQIRLVQLDRAMHLILNSNLTTVEIAAASGFATREYLTQVFRKKMGMTIQQYRRKFRT